MAQSSSLKVHQVLMVAPPHETTPISLPFTFYDSLWLRLPPVERLFFYELPNSTTTSFFDSILPNLKHSLSLTLQHFLPLVGNITWPLVSPQPIINYVPGDVVPLTVAESVADFNHLCSNLCEVEQRHLLIPRLKISHEQASVLALQVTFFPNFGFSVGITTHHAAVDGRSSTLFLKAWAYLCSNLLDHHHNSPPTLSLPENLTPFFDRSVIRDPSGIGENHLKGWLNFGGETNNRSLKVMESFSPPQSDAVKGLFELTPSHIQKLKQHAQSKMKNKVRLSTFSVTCAYLLACMVKVDKPKSNRVAFIFTVDCRSRLDPPIKPTYFGNCIVSQLVVAETEALLRDDGFINALEGITEVLISLEDGVLNGVENWTSKIQPVINDRFFSTAGSPRFEVYGIDFGWGRPKMVDVTSIDKTGAFSLAESKNNIDGGIEIGLALNKCQMEGFAEHFAQGLELKL